MQFRMNYNFKSCALFLFCFSFGMAYEFIDSIGNDVDVVSDSEVSFIRFYNFSIVNM